MAIEMITYPIYILITIAWIYTLIKQAKKEQWIWFVVSLVFPLTALVWWIVKWTK